MTKKPTGTSLTPTIRPAERALDVLGADRRTAERRPAHYNAACVLGRFEYNVELLDLSTTGAKVLIRQGIVPRLNQDVSLRLMDGQIIEGFVTRIERSEIGLQFCQPVQEIDDALHFDDMGASFYSAILRFQIAKKE